MAALPGLAFPGLCWRSSATLVEVVVVVAGVAFLAAAGAEDEDGDEGGVPSNPNNLSVTGADCTRTGSAGGGGGGGGEDAAAGATLALPFATASGAGDLGVAGGEFGAVLPLKDSPANKSIVTRRRYKVG